MPVTPVPPFTPLPIPPSSADPANFDPRGDAFLGALPANQTEMNALGQNAHDNATSAWMSAAEAQVDASQTAADKLATAADRVQTGLDRTQTTADRVQTTADRVQTSADRVQTGLDAASADADAATASAAAIQAQIYATQQMNATSTTSNSLSAGAKTFTVETDKGFVPNQYLVLTPTADSSKFMQAVLNSYNKTTGALSVTADFVSAAGGPYTAWTIGVIGRMGASGQRNNIAITGNTTAIAGNNYFFKAICTLSAPPTSAQNDTFSACNCTGAPGPMIDFGSQKVKGRTPGVVTMDGKNDAVTVTQTNSVATGWGDI